MREAWSWAEWCVVVFREVVLGMNAARIVSEFAWTS